MRAVVWGKVGTPPAISEVDLGKVGPDEVRVKIAAAGVCHSDLHVVHGDWSGIAAPMVLGHEGSGVIVEVGTDVTDLVPGDHVVLSWVAPCGHCRACLAGRPTQCLTHANSVSAGGVLHDGTSRLSMNGAPLHHYSGVSSFAEEAIVPASGAIKVRKDAPLDVICIVGCAVATGVGAAINVAQVRPGSSVVVVGCGGVGLNVVQGARIAGAATIVAVDLHAEKTALACKMGATHEVDASKGDALDAIFGILPEGADYTFDAIGGKLTGEQCIKALAVGGVATMVGIPKAGLTVEFEPQKLVDFDQRILGANYGGIVPSRDIPKLVDWYVEGKLMLDELISARCPIEDADHCLHELESGAALRQILIPDLSSSRKEKS